MKLKLLPPCPRLAIAQRMQARKSGQGSMESRALPAVPVTARPEVETYYTEAGMDYEAWSPGMNMHFGYWRKGLSLMRLEAQLEEMTQQVLDRLGLPDNAPVRLGDLGCGLGAGTRAAVARFPRALLYGLSVVDWQIGQARERVGDRRAIFRHEDYTKTSFPDDHLNGAWCLESACHAGGLAKADLVGEAARILKSGATWVVADGFYKRGVPRNPLIRWVSKLVANKWAVQTFADRDSFHAALEDAGFEEIRWEEISWQIAPSTLHILPVTLRFFWTEILRHPLQMTRARWGHLLACVLAPVVGLARRDFGYFFVTARKG